MIAINSSKKQAIYTDPKAIQQNSFYWKSRSDWKFNNAFLCWGSKRNYFGFFTRSSKSIVKVFHNLLWYNINIKWLNINNSVNVGLSNSQLNKSKSATAMKLGKLEDLKLAAKIKLEKLLVINYDCYYKHWNYFSTQIITNW